MLSLLAYQGILQEIGSRPSLEELMEVVWGGMPFKEQRDPSIVYVL